MKIKFLMFVAVLATAFLGFGGVINAQTVDNSAQIAQLQAQIDQILAQIQTLQTQQSAPVTVPNTTTTAWCYTFTRNLGFAQSGTNDVVQLHTALQKEGISYSPDSGSTYSEGTAAGVIQFQTKYGLLPATGYTGTRTRAQLNSLYGCGTIPQPTQPSITVTSPNGGETYTIGAFMPITFSTNLALGSRFEINLMNSDKVIVVQLGSGQITSSHEFPNTQGLKVIIPPTVLTGNYFVMVNSCTGSATSTCIQDSSDGSFTITASTTQPSITVLFPNGGESLKIGETYAVKWTKQGGFPADAGYLVTLLKAGQPLYTIASSFKGSGNPSYDSLGNQYYNWQILNQYGIIEGSDYQVKVEVLKADGINVLALDASDSYFNIYSTSTNKPPVINGVESPTTLSVGEIGKWTVQAFDQENGPLSYSVNWGDVPVVTPGAGATANNFVQTATFTHSYSLAGQYKVIFTVKDNVGQTATTTVTVQVGQITQPSVTILSPNGGETYKNDGSPITVNWITKNVPSTFKFDVIRLRGYPNGGEYNLATSVSNDGQEIVVPTNVPVGSYTLEIKAYLNNVLVMDSSDSYFKIVNATQPVITSLGTSNALPGEKVAAYVSNIPANSAIYYIEFSGLQSGESTATLSSDGTYLGFTVPNLTPGNYNISALFLTASGMQLAVSNSVPFVIGSSQPSITVLSPNGGEKWQAGTTHNITWNSSVSGIHDIMALGADGSSYLVAQVISATSGSNSYPWVVGRDTGSFTIPPGQYKIQVYDSGSIANDKSENYFTITAATKPISVTCSASPSPASINQSVTWTPTVVGGSWANLYQWTGDAVGTSRINMTTYATSGTKKATVKVTDLSGNSATSSCSVVISDSPVVNSNAYQSSLASIADAIAKIAAQIQAMLAK